MLAGTTLPGRRLCPEPTTSFFLSREYAFVTLPVRQCRSLISAFAFARLLPTTFGTLQVCGFDPAIEKLRASAGAALKFAFPGCEAVIVAGTRAREVNACAGDRAAAARGERDHKPRRCARAEREVGVAELLVRERRKRDRLASLRDRERPADARRGRIARTARLGGRDRAASRAGEVPGTTRSPCSSRWR